MLKKISLIVLFFVMVCAEAKAGTGWEGVWEYSRYNRASGGALEIGNCVLNVCDFSIKTYHGAQTCNVSGRLKVDGNKGLFYKYLQYEDNTDEQKIVMKLNPEKHTINVDWQSGRFCSLNSDINGLYENKQSPLRYQTSFDCWADDLQEAEKTICASERLAKADREFAAKYSGKMTYLWKKERNMCAADELCLWHFYTKAIFEEYKNSNNGDFSLYQYFQNQNPEWYYPTDYALLRDYLWNNMPAKDYAAWEATLYDKMRTAECENCSYMAYDINGLFAVYESAFYIDDKGIWLAFVSADLPELEQKQIVVYAPRGSKQREMPLVLKKWVERLTPYHHSEGVLLKYFERPKIRITKRNWYHKVVGEILQDAPEPYMPKADE